MRIIQTQRRRTRKHLGERLTMQFIMQVLAIRYMYLYSYIQKKGDLTMRVGRERGRYERNEQEENQERIRNGGN
jgi:YesN/AraC family two-component response regulator